MTGPMSTSPHRLVNPPELAPAVGYAHAVVAAPGRTVYLGGQTGTQPDGSMNGTTMPEQFDAALANLVTALAMAGGRPDHLVSVTIYVIDVPAYRAELADLGVVYRKHLGRHYPAIALLGVSRLFDDAALLELVAIAVVPDGEQQ